MAKRQKLTPIKTIQEHLEEMNDTSYSDSVYAQMCYGYGDAYNKGGQYSSNGSSIPWYPTVVMKKRVIGTSMRIMNASILAMAKIMMASPDPSFPQLPKPLAEVRKQAFLTRYQGNASIEAPEWDAEHQLCFLDGDNLGLGFVQYGISVNPKTGKTFTTCQHVPRIFVLRDRHETNPSKYRRIAFVKHLSPVEAYEKWGKERCQKYIKEIDTGGSSSGTYKVMRVIEFWDLGENGSMPTMAIIPNDIGEDPLEHAPNTYGYLNFAYMEHILLPGMEHHIGRIVMQMATQEALNQVEKRLRRIVMQGGGFDIVDVSKLNPEQLQRVARGDEYARFVGFEGGAEAASALVHHVPEREASQTMLAIQGLYDSMIGREGAVTSADAGQPTPTSRTLGENLLIDQRSAKQSEWSKKQVVKMFQRAVSRAVETMRLFDDDPMQVDVFGRTITLNDPNDERSSLANYFSLPSRVVIDEAALDAASAMAKSQRRLTELNALTPFVQSGVNPLAPISQIKFVTELLRAIGETEISEWIPQVQLGMPAPMSSPMPGQPGMETSAPTAGGGSTTPQDPANRGRAISPTGTPVRSDIERKVSGAPAPAHSKENNG